MSAAAIAVDVCREHLLNVRVVEARVQHCLTNGDAGELDIVRAVARTAKWCHSDTEYIG
jgi:hypothetical protein